MSTLGCASSSARPGTAGPRRRGGLSGSGARSPRTRRRRTQITDRPCTDAWDTGFALDILPTMLLAFVKVDPAGDRPRLVIDGGAGLVLAIVRDPRSGALAARHRVRRVRPEHSVRCSSYSSFYVLPKAGLKLLGAARRDLRLGSTTPATTAEVYRAGIEGVPRASGRPAALSLPSRRPGSSRAAPGDPGVLPALGNYVIALFKELPFLVVISVSSMVQVATAIGGTKFPLRRALHHCRADLPARQLPAASRSKIGEAPWPRLNPTRRDHDPGRCPPATPSYLRRGRKRFGDLEVLRELTSSSGPESSVTLIGPSGSGKTTILRL